MSKKILTVPEEIKDYKPYYLTGNEYVSIPLIDPENGGILEVNVISMEKKGLLSFKGRQKPLFKPLIIVNGRELPIEGNLRWKEHDNWIPEFTYEDDEVLLDCTILAPIYVKGFMYVLRISNKTGNCIDVSMGMEGSFEASEHTVFHNRLINCRNSVGWNKWTNSLLLEMKPDTTIAAIACSSNEPFDRVTWSKSNSENTDAYPMSVQNGGTESLSAKLNRTFKIESGCEETLELYFGVNCEADGASTTMVDMKRRGFKGMMDETESWLKAHTVKLEHNLSSLMNKNLLFNYFYSNGNAIDTEEIVPVTSRSPRYYVSAAFWSRDTFLWSFPGILLIDRERARDILLACYNRYIKNAGIHSLYINGSVLYPGFELDELVSFIIALKYYINYTEDYSVFEEKCVCDGIKRILKVLFDNIDENAVMFKTYLDPSDDPVKYEYLIYDNVMVYVALEFLNKMAVEHGILEGTKFDIPYTLKMLKQNILEHGTKDLGGKRMFVWSTDLKGNFEIYENPPGSLQLLSYYGFAERNCEIFLNTIEWIYSDKNDYYKKGSKLQGTGCAHAGNPWPMSAASAMLCGEIERGLEFFSRVSMDNGFACETVNPDTGQASTGLAFATCAGFIGYSLYRSLSQYIK